MSSSSTLTAQRRPTLNSMVSILTVDKLDSIQLLRETDPTTVELVDLVAGKEVSEVATIMRDRTLLLLSAKMIRTQRRAQLQPSKERKFCFDHLLICLSYHYYYYTIYCMLSFNNYGKVDDHNN